MIGAILTLIQDEARRIWCHRWLGLACAAVILAGGLGYVMSIPNVYDAWGQVYVNKQTPIAEAARSVSLTDDGFASAGVVEKTLLNDQNLERFVRETNPDADRMNRAQLDAAVQDLRQRIHIVTGDDGFVEFHYADSDPVHGAQMVKRLMDQFVATNVNRSRSELTKVQAFLDEQIASYKGLLADAQGRINALRSNHAGLAVLPASEAETATEQVLVNAPSRAHAAQTGKASAAAERVASLEAKLEQLRAVYTEQYPDVVSTRRQLADAVATQTLEAALRPAKPDAATDDPAAAAPQRLVGRAIRRPPIPPAVAAEWADAQRSAEVLRINYQQLAARREATRMSLAVFGSDASGKFQVTRAPTPPIAPVGPKRQLFTALVVAAALAGGLAAAYLRGAVRGIMVSPRELELACQLPVIGTVTWEPAWSTEAHRRRGRALPSRSRRDMPKPPRRPALRWLSGAKSVGEVR